MGSSALVCEQASSAQEFVESSYVREFYTLLHCVTNVSPCSSNPSKKDLVHPVTFGVAGRVDSEER